MNQAIRSRKRYLEAIFNFSRVDISSISEPQRHALEKEISALVTPFLDEEPLNGSIELIDLPSLQGMLKPILGEIEKGIRGQRVFYQIDFLVPQLHKGADERLVMTIQPKVSTRNLFVNAFIVSNFLQLLDGIPLSSILQCPECKKIFVNFSRRNKIYCSTTCYGRVYARERLKKLRKSPRRKAEYLKKQREYSRRTYEKKMRSLFGPSNRIRIGRKEIGRKEK